MSSPKFDNEFDRLVTRALREERDRLPQNFASETAAFVEAASRAASDRLELWLQRGMVVALMVAAIITLFLVGGRALVAFSSILDGGWFYIAALCVGVSLLLQRWLRLRRLDWHG